ncbi:hypothetical protein G7046_g209 [Stylonectria norvegica]|nr:hypothetical protein G7046_g209 [Stylonectria norvegica]
MDDPQAPKRKRSVKIASASGAITDMRENLVELAENAEVDFIVGDWMSEYNMSSRGTMKASRGDTVLVEGDDAAFEYQFLESLQGALPAIARKSIKLAVNAGASDTEKLYDHVVKLVEEQKLGLKVSWVEGDEVLPALQTCLNEEQELRNITTGQKLRDWEFEPVYAQCYLGCWGIVEAFRHGADIVICGRVADAAPTMGAAAFWHDWRREQYQELAHSLIAGHLIECSFYVTGGNYTGFKSLPQGTSFLLNPPIARVQADGTFYIERHSISGRGGEVSVNTCRSQLLYELQGPRYYNSDVVAFLPNIKMEDAGPNSVFVHNIEFVKPPPTTKVGITAPGGFQAEVHYFLVGLDIKEKADLLENQLRQYLTVDDFTLLKFTISGTAKENPSCQDESTVDFRIFAQAKTEEALSRRNFLEKCWNIVMSTYPGATFAVDYRQALPKAYNEYFVTILPLNLVRQVAHSPWKRESTPIEPPRDTVPYVYEQHVSSQTADPIPLESFGPTTLAPLGYIVHARSGDKSSDCNVGFYVRNADEYSWLRTFLSSDKIIELLGKDYNGKSVERFELPNVHGENLFAVAFSFETDLNSCAFPA